MILLILGRGYNAFVFEGPGQGVALYEQGLVFRPDFEHVLTPTIDWLIQRPGPDKSARSNAPHGNNHAHHPC